MSEIHGHFDVNNNYELPLFRLLKRHFIFNFFMRRNFFVGSNIKKNKVEVIEESVSSKTIFVFNIFWFVLVQTIPSILHCSDQQSNTNGQTSMNRVM